MIAHVQIMIVFSVCICSSYIITCTHAVHTVLYTHTNDTHNDKDIIYPQILGPRCAVKICYSMFWFVTSIYILFLSYFTFILIYIFIFICYVHLNHIYSPSSGKCVLLTMIVFHFCDRGNRRA